MVRGRLSRPGWVISPKNCLHVPLAFTVKNMGIFRKLLNPVLIYAGQPTLLLNSFNTYAFMTK